MICLRSLYIDAIIVSLDDLCKKKVWWLAGTISPSPYGGKPLKNIKCKLQLHLLMGVSILICERVVTCMWYFRSFCSRWYYDHTKWLMLSSTTDFRHSRCDLEHLRAPVRMEAEEENAAPAVVHYLSGSHGLGHCICGVPHSPLFHITPWMGDW